MLRRIKIERFKNIELFDQELGAVTVLVGTNNSGKTSVLNAIHTSVALAQSRLRLARDSTPNADGVPFTINVADIIYLPSVEANWLARNAALSATTGPRTLFVFDGKPEEEGTVEILLAEGKNLSVRLSGASVVAKIERIDAPFSIYVPGLAGIARNETMMSRGSLLRAVARGDANLVLRNVLALLNDEASKWARFSLVLSEMYPGHSIEVNFNKDTDEHIMVSITVGNQIIPLDCMGTGFLQTIQILSYIYLFEPIVTLLDEPDSHLHPNNQRILAGILSRLASEGRTKIIMATHSRHIIDAMRNRPGVQLTWMRAGLVAAPTTHLALLSDLGALDNAEGLLAAQIDFVVLTEDQNRDAIRLLLEANGATNGRFQVWAYKGCSKLDVAEALGQFIHEVSPTTRILVHRDSDFLDDGDKVFIKQQFEDRGMDVFFPDTPDPEGMLCRLDHLKHLNPGLEAQVQAAFDRALAMDAEELKEAAKKGREEVDVLRHKLKQPTQGEAAIRDWVKAVDLTLERWRHGKLLRTAMRKHFQSITGQNLKTDAVSPHLGTKTLQDFIQKGKVGS